MKQVQKSADILRRLQKAVGVDVPVAELSVFEAIALNTQPLRKSHPLYRGAVADRSLLLEMAAALEMESRPLQLQHDSEPLPAGRVFYGEVVDRGSESELRVLFFVDATEDKIVRKIEAGTVDQVSVGILPRQILNSKSGFDYLGADATDENIWTGSDNDGNTIGEAGVFGRLVGLDKFFELSLVGQGAARNARIVARDQSVFGSSYQRLAASGMDPNHLVLVANTRIETMDLTTLVASLTDTKVALHLKTTEFAALTATNVEQAATIATLTARVAELSATTEGRAIELAAHAATTAELAVATTALKGVATKILTAAGKLGTAVPETVAELDTLITETTTALSAVLVAGAKSKDAVSDLPVTAPVTNGAFQTLRARK